MRFTTLVLFVSSTLALLFSVNVSGFKISGDGYNAIKEKCKLEHPDATEEETRACARKKIEEMIPKAPAKTSTHE